MFYEFRLFNSKGCFQVREYGSEADAMKRFDSAVEFTSRGRKALADADMLDVAGDCLATEIQVVQRNDWMTSLVEIANWKAAA
jgi:hypothetical protein